MTNDLISRDYLLKRLEPLEPQGSNKFYRQACNDMIHKFSPQLINEAPAVDAIEVVHAYWIQSLSGNGRYKMGCVCSNCRRKVKNQDYGHTDHYCPNCGAKMDKRRESEASE